VLDLEPIRARLAEFAGLPGPVGVDEYVAFPGDVLDLIAEVEALREQHAELIAFLVSVPSSMQCACGRTVTLDVGSD
jgi:hypothetical protein